jgi:hypothetical protein
MNVEAIRIQTEKIIALRQAKNQSDWTDRKAITYLEEEVRRSKTELARLCED